MNEHGLANTSEFSSGAVEQRWKSAQELSRRARKQASEAGEYVARNVAQYPFEALLLAGLIGYGIGFLMHTRWSSEPRQQTSAPVGHSDDVLLDVARARMTDRRQPAN
jgi:hypothetical protein